MPRKNGPKPTYGPGQPRANRPDITAQIAKPQAAPPQAVRAPTGGPYGQASKLQASQAAVPLPNRDALYDQAIKAAQNAVGAGPGLARPTERPDEPITAGAARGPGPNTLPGLANMNPDPNEVLRAMVLQNPQVSELRLMMLLAES
jgi:hypothetical protein